MSYRNSDGSVTVNDVCMTKATYQHIHDSVMCEFAPSDFIDEVMAETAPEKREELYRKLIFEAYIEEVSPLRTWVYRGKEEEAKGLVWIHECNISKEAFENMENFVWSYTDESVLSFEDEETAEARESAYIETIVEDYVREQAMSADLSSVRLGDDLFEVIFSRYES